MLIKAFRVRGYRSIQDLSVRLGRVTVFVGPNGCGKSNLYRSLYVLSAAARGQLARMLAFEGGMPSALWAGEQRKNEPKRITLDLKFDGWSYHFSCGLRQPSGSAFQLDPFVREEQLFYHDGGRQTELLSRKNAVAWLRDENGNRVEIADLSDAESILSEVRDPFRYPELAQIRTELLNWRFYHHFRTDDQSLLRFPQVGVFTPVLSHEGDDLAAALQTILEIGDYEQLSSAIDHAFPGSELEIELPATAMHVTLKMPEFRRPFTARELSDGTLKYLCLLAALLTPRPPNLLAFNEPDSNLHVKLIEPLAHLIANSAKQTQIWIVTHSEELAGHLERLADASIIWLRKENGATIVVEAQEADDATKLSDETGPRS